MDHKALIASLTAQERAALLAQTDMEGLRQFALHFGIIVVMGALIAAGAPKLLMLPQGIAIVFLFTTLHETVHRTPFKTDALNLWVGRLCGFLVFLGPDWFRHFHLAHHRFTHDPKRDPELASPKPQTAWQYLRYLSGVPDTVERWRTLWRNAWHPNTDAYVPDRARARVMREARVLLALYAAVAAVSLLMWSPLVLYVWLLPVLLGTPFLRGYLLAEHARCPHAASMFENTRTTLTNRVVRFLAWNMPYHAEHHAYPAVPFHKLAAFHDHAAAHIRTVQDGYAPFNGDYLRDSLRGRIDP